MVPRVPRHVGLGFAIHKTPIDHADLVFSSDREDRDELTLLGASHILGAYDRTVEFLEERDVFFEIICGAVAGNVGNRFF